MPEKWILVEAVKRTQTREGTIADTLRKILTSEDHKDVKTALPMLTKRVQATGAKADIKRVRRVLNQLLEEAGVLGSIP